MTLSTFAPLAERRRRDSLSHIFTLNFTNQKLFFLLICMQVVPFFSQNAHKRARMEEKRKRREEFILRARAHPRRRFRVTPSVSYLHSFGVAEEERVREHKQRGARKSERNILLNFRRSLQSNYIICLIKFSGEWLVNDDGCLRKVSHRGKIKFKYLSTITAAAALCVCVPSDEINQI
jgi:hypothetical protein